VGVLPGAAESHIDPPRRRRYRRDVTLTPQAWRDKRPSSQAFVITPEPFHRGGPAVP
jgi:hypothetical protein